MGARCDNISKHVTEECRTSQVTRSTQNKSHQCHENSNLRNSPNAGGKKMVRTNGTERMFKDSTFFDIIRKKKMKTWPLDKELRKIIIRDPYWTHST